MPREVTDAEGTTWTCIQAYAGLSNDAEKRAAAQVDGAGGRYEVVCTPSGGTQTVRLALEADWEAGLSDEQLLGAIRAAQAAG
jgi:hypothetical protein